MKITSSLLAFDFFQRKLTADVEEFWVAALRNDRTVSAASCLFRGTVDACMVHPRDVFRFACLQNATSILIAHNHPSGNPEPSYDDKELTDRLMGLSSLMQIPLNDHIIVGQGCYYSFADGRINYLSL